MGVFSQFFDQMVSISLHTIDLSLFFRSLKGCCHGNRFQGKIGEPTCMLHADILKRIGISQIRVENIK